MNTNGRSQRHGAARAHLREESGAAQHPKSGSSGPPEPCHIVPPQRQTSGEIRQQEVFRENLWAQWRGLAYVSTRNRGKA